MSSRLPNMLMEFSSSFGTPPAPQYMRDPRVLNGMENSVNGACFGAVGNSAVFADGPRKRRFIAESFDAFLALANRGLS